MTVGVIWPPHVVNDATLLIAEVRRLRGLITESAETINLALTCSDPPPDISGRALVEAGREMSGMLLAEARAIQAEGLT
jgi:hypothetical protein